MDAELSHVLRVVRREGSILGDILRKAYDRHPLRHSTKTHEVTLSTGHHISIVGAITPSELQSLTDEVALLNGFANRFLYVWSELVELLPFGGDIDRHAVEALARRFDVALEEILRRPAINGTRSYTFAKKARPLWEEVYEALRLGTGDTEAFRAITSRNAAHAARIALI